MIRLTLLPVLLAIAVAIPLLVAADDSHGIDWADSGPGALSEVSGVTGAESRGTPAAGPVHVKAAICEVFGQRCGPALRIASCETGGTFNPWARGRAGERGLFQIHPIHFGWLDEARLWLPGYNSLIAFRLSRGGRDWSAWSCRP